MFETKAAPPWTRDDRLVRVLVAAAVLLVVCVAAGVAWGQRNPISQADEVECLSAPGTISCELSDGWTVAVPLDVRWTDSRGGEHGGDRPECLPPTGIGTEEPVLLHWVEASVDGSTWRQVVMVTCLD